MKYQLKRVISFWNLYSESRRHLYFMLAPPYVKIRNPILYLKELQDIKEEQEDDDNSDGGNKKPH
jgi:hypothetical protein